MPAIKPRIQYANKFAGSSNYWKNSIGMNKAIIDNDVLGTKAEQEKKFAEFAKGKPEYEGVGRQDGRYHRQKNARYPPAQLPVRSIERRH